ncbi:MAG: triose-phosphate isomerase [Pseudomonadota bacterium]
MVRTLIAGNWKMNGLNAALGEAKTVAERLSDFPDAADCLLCPPATLVGAMASVAGGRLKVGGQTCHPAASGAHTGDVSAEMLADAGADYVIVGHSERRADHGESDSAVKSQAQAALRAGLIPIICVGESLAQRQAGETLSVISAQLDGSLPDASDGGPAFVVAYEPIWAIGTGEVATIEQIGEVHGAIRQQLSAGYGDGGTSTPILYGGSMKPGNAGDILGVDDVNGGLIGGASLKAADFMAIYEIAVS